MMMLASYEQVVIDNEIMGATYRMLKGVEVNDYPMSVDLLRKTGHGGLLLNYLHII
ncbi:MAG: trimethylamine methyltransferase family protein [Candidatus Humimicrobiaceae bacterium]